MSEALVQEIKDLSELLGKSNEKRAQEIKDFGEATEATQKQNDERYAEFSKVAERLLAVEKSNARQNDQPVNKEDALDLKSFNITMQQEKQNNDLSFNEQKAQELKEAVSCYILKGQGELTIEQSTLIREAKAQGGQYYAIPTTKMFNGSVPDPCLHFYSQDSQKNL